MRDDRGANRRRKSGSDGLRRPRAGTTRRFATSSGRSRSFPSWGPRITASPRPTARSAERETPSGRSRSTRDTAPAGRRIEDPVWRSVTALREDARATLQRGIALAEAGDVAGAIAAHEAALARDPSLTQAHANLIALYGRAGNWAKAEEHYRAAVARGRDGPSCTTTTASFSDCRRQWDAAADAYRQALRVNPLHAHAHNNLGQCSSAARLRRRGRRIPAGGRGAADVPARHASTSDGCCWCWGGTDRGDRSSSRSSATGGCRDAPLSVCAVDRPRPGRHGSPTARGWPARRSISPLQFGQTELAAAIAVELAKLK